MAFYCAVLWCQGAWEPCRKTCWQISPSHLRYCTYHFCFLPTRSAYLALVGLLRPVFTGNSPAGPLVLMFQTSGPCLALVCFPRSFFSYQTPCLSPWFLSCLDKYNSLSCSAPLFVLAWSVCRYNQLLTSRPGCDSNGNVLLSEHQQYRLVWQELSFFPKLAPIWSPGPTAAPSTSCLSKLPVLLLAPSVGPSDNYLCLWLCRNKLLECFWALHVQPPLIQPENCVEVVILPGSLLPGISSSSQSTLQCQS